MAKIVTLPDLTGKSVAGFEVAFHRNQCFPLEMGKHHKSKEKALEYANDPNDTAYYGQQLEIFNESNPTENGIYRIEADENEGSKLIKLADLSEVQVLINQLRNELEGEISTGTGSAGYQGSYTDLTSKTTITKGMIFNILASEAEAFNTKYPNTEVEVGDWLVVKQGIDVANITSDNFSDIFGVWEKNLTGAITKVSQPHQSNNTATTVVVSVEKENTNSSELKITTAELAVTGVGEAQTSSDPITNVVVGLDLINGKVTPKVVPFTNSTTNNSLYLFRQFYTGNTDSTIDGTSFKIGAIYEQGSIEDSNNTQLDSGSAIIIANRNKNDYNNTPSDDNISIYYNGLLLSSFIDYKIYSTEEYTFKNNEEKIELPEKSTGIVIFNSSCQIDSTDFIEVVFNDIKSN